MKVSRESLVGMHVVDASEVLLSLNDGGVLKLKATRQEPRLPFDGWSKPTSSSFWRYIDIDTK